MAQELPPGPGGPTALMAAKWNFRPWDVMREATASYGDVWTLSLPGHRWLAIADPKLIEDVFNADPEEMHTGEANSMVTELLGPNSLLALDGADHAAHRKLLRSSLQYERMESHRELMGKVCAEQLETWPLLEPLKLYECFNAMTLEIILSVVLGVEAGPAKEALRARISELISFGDSPWRMLEFRLLTSQGRKPPRDFRRRLKAVDALLYEQIAEARRDRNLADRNDILAILLEARHEDGSPMTDRELRDELLTLLSVGQQSSATATAWALERLLRHPDAFDRLRAEAQTEGEEYIDAVIKETLRLRPPLPMVARKVNKPFRLGEYDLEPGTMIAVLIYQVHRRPDDYPDPEQFRPERFLDQSSGDAMWIPFGGGHRACIGKSFAIAEMKAVLRTLALHARLVHTEWADEPIVRSRIQFAPGKGAGAVLLGRNSIASGRVAVPAG